MRIRVFIIFILFVNLCFSQSKKKQIEILNYRIDSLIKQSINFQNQILRQNLILTNVQDQNNKLNNENSQLRTMNEGVEFNLIKKNYEIKDLKDSLNNLIQNKVPPAVTYSYAFDRIFSNQIQEHLKKLVVKYPTYPESDDRYYSKNNTALLDTRLFLENNKMKALLITIDRVPIDEDTRPQLNIKFFIIDCQNINKPNIIYKWSSLLPECPVDHGNDIIDVQFTDLNNDGNIEVWTVNEKFCKGDVSLNELIIYKYENGKHCTLESMTNSHYIMDQESNSTMDDNSIRDLYGREPLIFDQCFSNEDPIFINYAKHLREKNLYGMDGFRFEQDGYDNAKFWNRNKR